MAAPGGRRFPNAILPRAGAGAPVATCPNSPMGRAWHDEAGAWALSIGRAWALSVRSAPGR